MPKGFLVSALYAIQATPATMTRRTTGGAGPSGSYSITPAIAPVMHAAMTPQVIPLKPRLARSLIRLGAMPPIPPICHPALAVCCCTGCTSILTGTARA